MIKLIKNEIIKIFKRKNTYILLFIVITLIAGYNIFEKMINVSQDISSQYKKAYKNDKMLLENYDILDVDEPYEDIVERLALEKYAIENNIEYNIMLNSENKNALLPIDARILLMKFFNNFELITIFIFIYFSTIILSEEYNTGTIKNLLTKPYKRITILTSKIITLVLVTIMLLITIMLFQTFLGGVLFGFDSYSLDSIRYNISTQNIETARLSQYMFVMLLCKMPMYLLIIFVGLLIGIITNNIALNILFLFGMYVLSTINYLINDISKYIFIFNWDLSKFLFGVGKIANPLIISIISLLIIFVLLCFIFKNKDIRNE